LISINENRQPSFPLFAIAEVIEHDAHLLRCTWFENGTTAKSRDARVFGRY
jgi:hypothetical protein